MHTLSLSKLQSLENKVFEFKFELSLSLSQKNNNKRVLKYKLYFEGSR